MQGSERMGGFPSLLPTKLYVMQRTFALLSVLLVLRHYNMLFNWKFFIYHYLVRFLSPKLPSYVKHINAGELIGEFN